MDPNELYHHGIKGMKWGVRRTKAQLGYKTGSGKKKSSSVNRGREAVKNYLAKRKAKKTIKKEVANTKKKTISEMSDAELRDRISRLQMEKQYKDLVKSTKPQTSKGKQFVMSVLENSGKNIATQTTTYVMGRAVNKAFADIFDDPAIVNPKKGQKDK